MLRNGLYNLLGGWARVVVSLLTISLLLRIVGVEEYGLLTLVLATTNLVTLAEAGLPAATTVFVARDRAAQNVADMSGTLTVCLAVTVVLATVTAGALWIGGGVTASLFSALNSAQRDVVTQSLRIAAIIIWFRLLQQIMVGVLQAFGRYGALNVIVTLQALLINLGMVAIAWSGGRTIWLIGWQALVGACCTIANAAICIHLLRSWQPRLTWQRQRAREIVTFSGYAWISSLGSALFTQGDRILVGGLLGLGPLGVYGAIASATTQINTLSGMVVQPLMPVISALTRDRERNTERILEHIKPAWQTLVFVAFGLGGAIFTLAPLVLRLAAPELDTPEYTRLLRLAAVLYTLYSLNALGFFVLLGSERARDCMIVNITSALATLTLIGLGAWYWGLAGAVMGNIGYSATLLFNFLALRGLSINSRSLLLWATMPILWAVSVIVLSLFAGDQTGVLLVLFAIQCGVLVAWYVVSQHTTLRSRLPVWPGGKAHL